MSLHLPARRVAASATAAARATTSTTSSLLPRTQRRNAGWFGWGRRGGTESTSANSPLAKELTRREREQMLAKQNMDRTQGTSIFDEEIKDPSRAQRQQAEAQESGDGPSSAGVITATTVKEHVERAVNPDPRWRIRFLKKKVMQMARTDPSKPMPRAQHIRMTEKQHKSASPPLPTSTKKLVHLSHQIVGKTVDEAITQMRFSKKKMAREVKWQLEDARDRAIAAHGMGLSAPVTRDNEKPRKILTKDGRWIEVSDPTTLYVDESWVTKGPWRGMRIQYHARSRMSMMWRPSASISLVLKEEKTRIRQHEEKVEKEAKKAPWVHLPNRPVTAQRQYYSW
ncbi:ribosomal protein L22 [Hypoxylon rubiginosum]|uniref:Ribosomal protein L22 n=1 Tax=Hypoxylon rubiginosum TaxID=110542 RepID=A0ACC0D2A0_9PEZI|nr:ribosomal protein L22 [Hypoxylon rubiginosum]